MAWIETHFPELNPILNEIRSFIDPDLIKDDLYAHSTLIYDVGENIDAIEKKFYNLPKMKMKIVDIRLGNVSPVILLECECKEYENLFWTLYDDNETNGNKQHTLIKGHGRRRNDNDEGFVLHITVCWLKLKDHMTHPSVIECLNKKFEFLKKVEKEIEIDKFVWYSEDVKESRTFFLK